MARKSKTPSVVITTVETTRGPITFVARKTAVTVKARKIFGRNFRIVRNGDRFSASWKDHKGYAHLSEPAKTAKTAYEHAVRLLTADRLLALGDAPF